MKEKIYPNNKIIMKKPEDIITFDYISPTAQLIFNFIVWQALKQKNNVIALSAIDYFYWQKKERPQGDDYKYLYKNIETLKKSWVVMHKIENNKKIIYEWPLIAQSRTIKTIKNKTEKIEITLNPYLLHFYKWQRANVPIDIDTTQNLSEKYAYKLYEFLKYHFRKNAKNNYIDINDLRRILTAPKSESNSRFLRYFACALRNINATTDIKVSAKIRVKNKKALASAEIKFAYLNEKIAKNQYDFLMFERDFKQKNEE